MKVWANVDTEWKYSKSHYQVAQTTQKYQQVPNVSQSTRPSYLHIMSIQQKITQKYKMNPKVTNEPKSAKKHQLYPKGTKPSYPQIMSVQVQQYLTPRAIMPPLFRWFYYFASIVRRLKMR